MGEIIYIFGNIPYIVLTLMKQLGSRHCSSRGLPQKPEFYPLPTNYFNNSSLHCSSRGLPQKPEFYPSPTRHFNNSSLHCRSRGLPQKPEFYPPPIRHFNNRWVGGRGQGVGAKVFQTYRQTYRHTDRPSDEAGPRGAFAPKKISFWENIYPWEAAKKDGGKEITIEA